MTAGSIGRVLGQAVVVALGLAVVGAVVAADGGERPADERARHILEATGVKGGLIVHLGCGDGRLTAALRASDRKHSCVASSASTALPRTRKQVA